MKISGPLRASLSTLQRYTKYITCIAQTHVGSREDRVLSVILARTPGLRLLSYLHTFLKYKFPLFSFRSFYSERLEYGPKCGRWVRSRGEIDIYKVLLNLRSFDKKALSCALLRTGFSRIAGCSHEVTGLVPLAHKPSRDSVQSVSSWKTSVHRNNENIFASSQKHIVFSKT